MKFRVGRNEVSISNPDKVFFPARGLTKGDLVSYYLDLADCVIPHLRRRPFHMKRFPNGVEGDRWSASDVGETWPFVRP